MVGIDKFLSDGQIDPLSFGMSRDEVELALGKAEGEYEYEDVTIEKRGALQLHYSNNSLFSIIWSVCDDDDLPIEINGKCPTKTTTINQFLDACDENAIPWKIEQSQSFDRQLAIRTSSKVVVFFDLDFREFQRIVVTD